VERSVADCSAPRATEVWVVEPTGPITWANQPPELTRLEPAPQAGECPGYPAWNAHDAVARAVAEGRSSLTVVVRVAEEHQADPSRSRVHGLAGSPLRGAYNHPPDTPTNLFVEHYECGAVPYITTGRPVVSATTRDVNGGARTGQLAFWPVSEPGRRVEVTMDDYSSRLWGHFPEGMVQDGGTYAFAARSDDGLAKSAWSEPCEFTADLVRPSQTPKISSTTFPENSGPPGDGAQGSPGDFTFDALGDEQIVAFEYSGTGIDGGLVAADRAVGRATVMISPTMDARNDILVVGVDRAGWRSPGALYRYWVRATEPYATDPYFEIGAPTDVELTARLDDAVAFGYRLDGGEEKALPVGPDRKGVITLAFPEPTPDYSGHTLEVWTTNARGERSGVLRRTFTVNQVVPSIYPRPWSGLVGEKRVITFEPWSRDDVVSYAYRIGDGPEQFVPAGADGTATVEHTPTAKGTFAIRAVSINSAGYRSGVANSRLRAEAPAPTVTSATYPGGYDNGGPGVEGVFTLSSPQLPVVSYRYSFNGGQERTVPAGPDGTAVIRWAPPKPDHHSLSVVGVTASGVVTDSRSHSFRVRKLPPTVTSPQFPEGGTPTARVGEPIRFVVTPALAGSTEVLWRDRDSDPGTVVPVGPEGTAVFDLVPTSSYFRMSFWSRKADGTLSGELLRTYWF
ncbi:hypothetical protein, partial [Actinosynnema sp.]|uniref:hypothetical protein n=1 Tax=Actinosynnema sp. TaxID=1872144 RepID=UPI003F854B43